MPISLSLMCLCTLQQTAFLNQMAVTEGQTFAKKLGVLSAAIYHTS